MLNGLDLFSGIGGISLALSPWVTPVAYCEIERYAQAVLLSRMADGTLACAPIWDDVKTLGRDDIKLQIDIITGGFPCQDISVAGAGASLDGERSGLYWEIYRLVGELKPRFVFLENVPAITTRLEMVPTGIDGSFWRGIPRPLANDAKNSTLPPSAINWDSIPGWILRSNPTLAGRRLNPGYYEEIMMYPKGWTELKDWVIQWFRSKPAQRLKFYQEAEKESQAND